MTCEPADRQAGREGTGEARSPFGCFVTGASGSAQHPAPRLPGRAGRGARGPQGPGRAPGEAAARPGWGPRAPPPTLPRSPPAPSPSSGLAVVACKVGLKT